jgi:hypoxanthine phosphoribosyltransferase
VNTHTNTQQRQFRRDRILHIPVQAYERALALLAEAAASESTVDAIVAIANGGCAPAYSLRDRLDAPCLAVIAKHNPTDAHYTQATGRVSLDLTPLMNTLNGRQLHGNVVLVDDICGSGATYRAVLESLAPHLDHSARVRTLCLCRNTAAGFTPDLWIWDVDDWVLFPWEPATSRDKPTEALPVPEQVRTP